MVGHLLGAWPNKGGTFRLWHVTTVCGHVPQTLNTRFSDVPQYNCLLLLAKSPQPTSHHAVTQEHEPLLRLGPTSEPIISLSRQRGLTVRTLTLPLAKNSSCSTAMTQGETIAAAQVLPWLFLAEPPSRLPAVHLLRCAPGSTPDKPCTRQLRLTNHVPGSTLDDHAPRSKLNE